MSYITKSPLEHDGTLYPTGSEIDMLDEQNAIKLIRDGVLVSSDSPEAIELLAKRQADELREKIRAGENDPTTPVIGADDPKVATVTTNVDPAQEAAEQAAAQEAARVAAEQEAAEQAKAKSETSGDVPPTTPQAPQDQL